MLTSCHLSLRATALFTGVFLLRRRVGGSDTPVCDTEEQKRAKALGRLGSPASLLLMRFHISGTLWKSLRRKGAKKSQAEEKQQ